ncbi:MAG: PilZ domain-containing protein [Candidatus Eremiobacteraeota bacterium]|nr:PilZ domain-containing protein [Candidatus Eremiobacteraeota bacterium]
MLKDIISGFVSLFKPSADLTEDRRRVIRLRCRFAVYCIDLKEINTATVIDMGLQGLRLECSKDLKPGTRVSLVYRGAVGERPKVSVAQLENDRQAAIESGVRCKVNWVKKTKYSKRCQIGVTYADSPERMSRSWVKKILKEIGFDEDSIFQRRKIVRVLSSIPCLVKVERGNLRGRVINMGAGGTLYQGDEGLNEGEFVGLNIGPYKDFEHFSCRGEVVTARYDPATNSWLCGIRFRTLDTKQVDLLGKYVVNLLKDQTAGA